MVKENISRKEKNLSAGLLLLVGLVSTSVVTAAIPERTNNDDYYFAGSPPASLVELGKNLFFDKIMSGNKNISCATCHHTFTGSSDGLSLGIGEGGEGVGIYRSTGSGSAEVEGRVGRNVPHLFNLGAKEFVTLNWNGIMATDPLSGTSGLILPSGQDTPLNLNNVLAGQALFPITNMTEMVGGAGENDVALALRPGDGRFPPIWDVYVQRLKDNPAYVTLFINAFDDVNTAEDITIGHYANAISGFMGFAFRSDNSPFDQYLRGDIGALTEQQTSGMNLFYGEAGCSTCHSGVFQTDHVFHAIAMPQIGGGPETGFPLEDRGRAEATTLDSDFAKFRTPSLRNVWITGPYGHDGAYNSLRKVVEHHLDPITSLENYNTKQAILPSRDDLDAIDFQGYNDLTLRQKIIDANELQPSTLTRTQMRDLLEFLRALTDWNALNMDWMVPDSVPSGLPVRD